MALQREVDRMKEEERKKVEKEREQHLRRLKEEQELQGNQDGGRSSRLKGEVIIKWPGTAGSYKFCISHF